MRLINTLGLLGIIIFLISCSSDDGDCSGDLICTTEFRIISVEVLDSERNLVIFDEFRVKNLQTDELIEIDWEPGDHYPIADDSMRNDLPAEGHLIELVGYIDGQEVLREAYLVGQDCCHITLLEGETTIQL